MIDQELSMNLERWICEIPGKKSESSGKEFVYPQSERINLSNLSTNAEPK